MGPMSQTIIIWHVKIQIDSGIDSWSKSDFRFTLNRTYNSLHVLSFVSERKKKKDFSRSFFSPYTVV